MPGRTKSRSEPTVDAAMDDEAHSVQKDHQDVEDVDDAMVDSGEDQEDEEDEEQDEELPKVKIVRCSLQKAFTMNESIH